jgi:hypothetical protein
MHLDHDQRVFYSVTVKSRTLIEYLACVTDTRLGGTSGSYYLINQACLDNQPIILCCTIEES